MDLTSSVQFSSACPSVHEEITFRFIPFFVFQVRKEKSYILLIMYAKTAAAAMKCARFEHDVT